MKELHRHITGDIVKNQQNTTLEKLWKDYLVKGLGFRCTLFTVNHEIKEKFCLQL